MFTQVSWNVMSIHRKADGRFIHNSTQLETSKMSFDTWMNKQILVNSFNGIFSTGLKNRRICMKNMKQPWMYVTKWKKSVCESYTFFYPNKITFWEKSNDRDSEKWVIARSSGGKGDGLIKETGAFEVSKKKKKKYKTLILHYNVDMWYYPLLKPVTCLTPRVNIHVNNR